MTDGWIDVRGARLHNLRNVDVRLPRGRLVAFTGVSGSGKSSLAFGTLHGEAQRRYFESVAPFARRLIHTAVDPQVRDVRGLPPAVALDQRQATTSSRSSVGTITTTSNTVRMLWSRAGDYPAGLDRLDSDHFSPNTAAGACPECSGLGTVHRPTEASMVPDPGLSIRDGAIASWPGAWLGKNFRDIVTTLGFDVEAPWHSLTQRDRDWILFTDQEPVVTVHPVRDASAQIHRPYQGRYVSAARHLTRTLAETKSTRQRERALTFVVTSDCPVCRGRRLGLDALSVTWQSMAIDEAWALPLDDLLRRCRVRRRELGPDVHELDATPAAEAVMLDSLTDRLAALTDLGLGHLSLGRPTGSVSTGELQRLRLGTLLHSGLFGVVYVLDEPSAGLHPRDAEPLMRMLRDLVEAGNTVCMVEHDMSLVRQCDWVVDVGPGAGRHGGAVLWSGPVDGLRDVDSSVTARYLDERVHLHEIRDDPAARRPEGQIELDGIELHNLHGIDIRVPLGVFVAITGVSGSGKTSVLNSVHDAVARQLGQRTAPRAEGGQTDDESGDASRTASTRIVGEASPSRLVRISQKPIGRTPRSNLATYTGLFDHVRKRFAATEGARRLGYGAGRFSFNVNQGRCRTCQGEGSVAVELLFMPGTYSTCPDCQGARYDDDTLQVTWHGHTIADVLALTVDDALGVYASEPPVRRALEALQALGLGYLTLGQPATELSGGEAQRIKLATELQNPRRSPTLYLLDEPTSGLAPSDRHRLLAQLHALVDTRHSVVVVEHDQAAVAAADWVIEMGPGAGADGGRVVSSGARP